MRRQTRTHNPKKDLNGIAKKWSREDAKNNLKAKNTFHYFPFDFLPKSVLEEIVESTRFNSSLNVAT